MVTPQPFVNWAKNQRSAPAARHLPEDEAAIAALVREVRARGETLRVVGAGHSWSDAALTEQHLVSLDRHAGIVAVDRQRLRVTVKAGTRLRDLIATLDAHGLALTNLGSIAEQSVAGAISTGTHGTGLTHGVLATQVVAMRLVTGTGEVRVLTAEDGDDLLDAARVSLGCLGIISELTLQVREAFDLEERAWSLSFADAARTVVALAREHAHLKAWWLPHTGRVQIFAANPTSAPRSGANALSRKADQLINQTIFPAILAVGRTLPVTVPALNRLVGRSYFGERRKVDRSDRVFNVAMPPRHLEMEYGLPLDAVPEVLRELERMITRRRLRVNFVQELRFVAADDCHLSPACGRESCQLGAYMAKSQDSDAYFAGFEAMALAAEGRPHWGKLFFADAAVLAPRYPRWERFRALRDDFDPDRIFTSAFTRRIMG